MVLRRVSLILLLIAAVAGAPTLAAPAPEASKGLASGIDIPYQKFVLPNGLTLIVHEDHKAPIVAVNIWYHVGSKNEKPGRTGFAHLFEHLMFNGSENYNDDYFKVLEKVGATDLNGTTNEDRTNYFENVPISAIDTVLWMESDRMGTSSARSTRAGWTSSAASSRTRRGRVTTSRTAWTRRRSPRAASRRDTRTPGR